jgi:type IV secretion system protein VirB8
MNAHERDLPAAAARKRYYQEAATWAADIHGSLRASRRVAWIVAGAAVVVATLEALALAALAPLKTVIPYTITVDRQTGYVETARGLQPGALSQDQAVTQSFLVQYVIARETFDATDLREAYHKVLLWSAGEAREGYQHLMQKTTPTSPLNLYAPTTVVSVTVKSVSLLSPTTALVRFDTTRTDAGSPAGSQQSWAAVMAFRYANAPMTMADRFINPLGFQVTRYRRDAETVAPAMAPLPAAGPPPAGALR